MSSSAPAPPAPSGNMYSNQMPSYGVDGGVLLTAILCFIFIVLIICIIHVCARHIISRHRHSRAAGEAAAHQQNRNGGLDASAVASLPIFVYGKGGLGRLHEEAVEVNDCVICLSAMEEGETVRLLPNCKHLLHAACVDKWLRSHSTCPVCRTTAAPVKFVDGNGGARLAVDATCPTTAAPEVAVRPRGVELHNEDVNDERNQGAEEAASTSTFGSPLERMMSWQWSRKTVGVDAGGVRDLERQ